MSSVHIEKKKEEPVPSTEEYKNHRYFVRGFKGYEWKDSYDHPYTIQESSSIEPHLWLGAEPHRMHLNRKDVQKVISTMEQWINTRNLP